MQTPYRFSGTHLTHHPPAAPALARATDSEPDRARRAKGMGSHAFL